MALFLHLSTPVFVVLKKEGATMQQTTVFIDRREDKRQQLQGDGVALLRTNGVHGTTVGEIIDISNGGVSFRYIAVEPPSDGQAELSLVSADHSFYLGNLPINTISDLEMAKLPFGSVSTRRRGVKFGELRQNQRFALQHFIRNYTIAEES
jgi:hypothetical protein